MSPESFNLTLEQKFEVQRMRSELQNMPREQVVQELLQVARLLMVKDNLIKSLIKGAII